MKKQFLAFAALLAMFVLVLSSCKKKPEPSTGEALFEYETDGLTVHFYNRSTIEDPKGFIWDFGDGSTSDQENPTHTYAQKGEYTVKFTVIDQADVEHSITSKITVDKASPVSLDDGTLSDWDNVSTFVIEPDSGGVIKKVKFDYDVNYIYVYVEAEYEDTVIHGIFFDTDIDSSTGFISHYWPAMGNDILAQAKVGDADWGVFSFAGANGHEWSWNQIQESDLQVLGAAEIGNGMVKYEIGYNRAKIPGLGLDADSIAVGVYLSNLQWAEIGYAPDSATASYPDGGYIVKLNLTQ